MICQFDPQQQNHHMTKRKAEQHPDEPKTKKLHPDALLELHTLMSANGIEEYINDDALCSSIDSNIQHTLQTFRDISDEREQLLEDLAQACSTEEHLGIVAATAIRIRTDCAARSLSKEELLDKITFYKNSAIYDYIRHPDDRIGTKTDYKIDQTDVFTITPVQVPYVSELLPTITTRHLILKSATGTGKTQLLVSLLSQHPDAKILSISSRISLVHDQMGRFGQSHGFKSYLDLRKKQTSISADRLCVSFDSLHKVVDIDKYDIVVLDECDSTVKHIFAESVKKRRQSVGALINALSHAKKIWALDADITDLSLCLLRTYCIKQDTTFIVNTVQPAKGRKVIVFQTKYDLLNDLIMVVDQNKRVFICSDTVDMAVSIKRVLDKKCGYKRCRIYTAQLGDKSELLDISHVWPKVQYVICSPTITYGVNDDVSKFDTVYAFYNNSTIDVLEQQQQVSRSRDAMTIKLWAQHKTECKYPTNFEMITTNVSNDVDLYTQLLPQELRIQTVDFQTGTFTISKESLFTQLYCYHLRNYNISRNDPKERLLYLLSLKGYDVEHSEEVLAKKDVRRLKKLIKKAKEEALVDKTELWNSLYYIPPEDRMNDKLEKDEQWRMSRSLSQRIDYYNLIPTVEKYDPLLHSILENDIDRHINMTGLYQTRDELLQRHDLYVIDDEFDEINMKGDLMGILACFQLEQALNLKRFQVADIKLVPEEHRIVHRDSITDQQIQRYKKLVPYKKAKEEEDFDSYTVLFDLLLSLYKKLCGRHIIKHGNRIRVDKKQLRIKMFNEEYIATHVELAFRNGLRQSLIDPAILEKYGGLPCRLNAFYQTQYKTLSDIVNE